MIYLHTGQPGAGKTLMTLHIVRKRAKQENRTVYYSGIQILKPEEFPGWVEMTEPEKWFELPDGAIIVHDEAQTLYRPRGVGSKVPPYVAELETHRHKGYDIYYVTQHPMLIDSNVRRLAGEHVHVVRAFGTQMATLHKWGQVKEQCDKSRADSIKESRPYPAELYGAYQSATVHTHKARIPRRVFLLALVPFVFLGLIYYAYSWYRATYYTEAEKASPEKTVSSSLVTSVTPAVGGDRSRPAAVKTTVEYLKEREPRIQGLTYTAPVYDRLTAPVRVPVPAACVQWSGKGCRCYTQQATRLNVPESLCAQVVASGYFLDFDPEQRRDGDVQEQRPGSVSDGSLLTAGAEPR